MCIHAIKAVGIGIGPEAAVRPGSRVHDEILPAPEAAAPVRPTNNAGGLEGGVTNGEDVRVAGFMKPISTLMKPLRSVDLTTMTEAPAAIERSDVCAVPPPRSSARRWWRSSSRTRSSRKFGGDSDRRDRAALRGHRRAGAPALRGARHARMSRLSRPSRRHDSSDPPLRRRGAPPARRARRRHHARHPAAHRRHDRRRCTPRRASAWRRRRSACRCGFSSRTSRAAQSRRIC